MNTARHIHWCAVIAAISASLEVHAWAAVSLFNGNDLTGWHILGGDGTYHVEAGEIVGTSAAPPSPNTFLVTDQAYADFVLDVDYFISDPSFNSGIQIRSQSLSEHNGGRVFGYQVEIDPSTRAWSGGLYFEGGSPDRPAEWLDDLDDNPVARSAFELGEWNHFRIEAAGTRIQSWINGVPAADYTDLTSGSLASGFIGLQIHQVTTAAPREVRWRNLSLSSVPTLIVNRETGEVWLSNDMDVPVELTNYSIQSPAGSLDVERWHGLADQQISGWMKTAATDTHLGEQATGDPLAVENGDSHSLGSPFTPLPVSFGVSAEDLAFEYSESDGMLRTGRVQYVGQNITNNLLLLVDPMTGQAVLKNNSPFAVSLAGYSIISDSSSLLDGNWQSFSDRGLPGWDEAEPTAESLSELNPFDELVLDSNARYNLGHIFDVSTGQRELELKFLLDAGSEFDIGAVLYRMAADFNLDQVVDQMDLQIWQGSYGVNSAADADGDGDTDGRDFLAWQRQVGQSASLMTTQNVPESSSLELVFVSLVTCFSSRNNAQGLQSLGVNGGAR